MGYTYAIWHRYTRCYAVYTKRRGILAGRCKLITINVVNPAVDFSLRKNWGIQIFYANEGQPFHLWFLWQLIIFVIFTAILRFFYLGVVGVAGRLRRIGLRA